MYGEALNKKNYAFIEYLPYIFISFQQTFFLSHSLTRSAVNERTSEIGVLSVWFFFYKHKKKIVETESETQAETYNDLIFHLHSTVDRVRHRSFLKSESFLREWIYYI